DGLHIVCSAALEQGRSSWTGKLLVVPMDGSHWTGVKAVAEEMGRRGHTVIVVIPEISMRLGPGKHYITKTFPGTYGQDLIDQMIVEHIREPEQSLLKSVTSMVRAKFDAVLTDPALPVGAILAYNLSVPAMYMLRGMLCGLDTAATACPDPPSYRVVNVFVSMLEPLICKVTFWPFKEITFNFLQRDVSLIEILSTGAVWLMRYDFSLEFPKPLMPNMQLIGGINCEISNPLNKVSIIFILTT
uniref:Uncharacterized protein n=1 Tax=Sinocyclocheilus grahami TaxID=75366 RepID=A0A672T9H2_SINGR